MYFALHCALALVLFLCVNWIGRHSVDFGYKSTSLFEEASDSLAINFAIRVVSPTVFIVITSAIFIYVGVPSLRVGIEWVAVYYFGGRAAVIILLGRSSFVNWVRFAAQAVIGILFAFWISETLIQPMKALMPDLETLGNELWLAIAAFLYAVANKVELSNNDHIRRQQTYINRRYRYFKTKFSDIVEVNQNPDALRLIVYAVLIYEDYARPRSVRLLERMLFFKKPRTTGVMQVSDTKNMSDRESVTRGTEILRKAWKEYDPNSDKPIGESVILAFNRDADYYYAVSEVLYLLSARGPQPLKDAYDELCAYG